MRTNAWWALVVAACGGGGGPGPVAVSVAIDGAPGSGVAVIFQDADSSLVANATTDVAGRASTTMAAGGYVTVVMPDELDTVAGVQPGDELVFAVGSAASPGVPSAISVTIPSDPAPGVDNYKLFTSCGGGEVFAGSATLLELADCAGGSADITLVSLAIDVPVDYLFTPGVAVGGGAGSTTAVTLAGEYTAMPALTASLSGLPASIDGATGSVDVTSARGAVYEGDDTTSGGSGSSSATVALPAPPIPDAHATMQVETALEGSAIDSFQLVLAWAPTATSLTFDYASSHLAAYTSVPAFSAADHAFEWTVAGDGATPDAVLATAQFERASPTGSTDWRWFVVAPASEPGTLALPVLPGSAAVFNAGSDDTVEIDAVEGIAVTGGYDALRSSLFAGDGLDTLVSSGTGTATLQAYLQGE